MYLKFNFYTYTVFIVVMFPVSLTYFNFEEEIKICFSEFFVPWRATVGHDSTEPQKI